MSRVDVRCMEAAVHDDGDLNKYELKYWKGTVTFNSPVAQRMRRESAKPSDKETIRNVHRVTE